MTVKAINRSTANEFHVWQRERLSDLVTICDVDSWVLNIAAADDQPRALIELKRSSIDVEHWRPFAEDRAQYAALLNLARAAGIPFWIVYFRKGEKIVEATRFHLFDLHQARPTYHGTHRVLSAGVFADKIAAICGKA